MSKRTKRPFTKKFKPAFDVICAGGSYQMAAKAADMSERHVRRTMAKPEVRSLMQSMAVTTILQAAPRAAARLCALMDSESAKVSLEASVHVLSTNSIRPPAASARPLVNINLGSLEGYSGAVITADMSDEQVKAIEDRHAAAATHGVPTGYLIRLKDRHGALKQSGPESLTIEHQPEEPEPAPAEAEPPYRNSRPYKANRGEHA